MSGGCPLGTLEAIHLKVVEASPDAKIVINSDGNIVVFNQQAEFMFGYDRSEVIGKSIDILLPEDLREIHKSHREGFMDEPRMREMGTGQILRGLKRNGKQFPVQIKLAPIVITGEGLHVLAVVRAAKDQHYEHRE